MKASSNTIATPVSPAIFDANATDDSVYREIMKFAVAAVCKMAGFTYIESKAHRLLSQLMNNYFNGVCRSAREACDYAGRTVVCPTDAFMGLVNAGVDVADFCAFLKSPQLSACPILPTPSVQTVPPQPALLKVGEPRPHPPHMPSFLPPFPDPHTYVRTEVSGEVDSNYEKVRLISAENKRCVENSLINYALAMHSSISVFHDLEKTLIIEAKEAIEHSRLMKQRRVEARRAARITHRLNQELASGVADGSDILMNDLLDVEANTFTAADENVVVDVLEEDTAVMKELEQEEMFEIKETEKAYIRRRIPEFCHILLPFEEERPYLSALVTDDNLDDDANHFARILSKEIEDEFADNMDDLEESSQINDGDGQ